MNCGHLISKKENGSFILLTTKLPRVRNLCHVQDVYRAVTKTRLWCLDLQVLSFLIWEQWHGQSCRTINRPQSHGVMLLTGVMLRKGCYGFLVAQTQGKILMISGVFHSKIHSGKNWDPRVIKAQFLLSVSKRQPGCTHLAFCTCSVDHVMDNLHRTSGVIHLEHWNGKSLVEVKVSQSVLEGLGRGVLHLRETIRVVEMGQHPG